MSILVQLFDPERRRPNPSPDDARFSVDVCCCDENDVHGICYFDFEEEEWKFHTDTLVDYNEVGAKTKWAWYYPPVCASDIVSFITAAEEKKSQREDDIMDQYLNDTDEEQFRGEGDYCTNCGGSIDHSDPHTYCCNCT